MNETASLKSFRGIGEKTEKLFSKAGVCTAGDMLLFFPRDYRTYPPIKAPDEVGEGTGGMAAVEGIIESAPLTRHFRGRSITTASAVTSGGRVDLIWFGAPYIRSSVHTGTPYIFYGRIDRKGDRLRLDQPKCLDPGAYQKMQETYFPVYHLTKGLKMKVVQSAARQALSLCLPLPENLPPDLLKDRGLMDRSLMFRSLHFPESREELHEAKKRLSYTEFLSFFLEEGLLEEEKGEEENTFSFTGEDPYTEKILHSLPYELTGGQKEALSDILSDFKGPFITERLIQGDVGSGKTIVAFLTMAYMAGQGFQSAIMAPTEVLAEQHLRTYEALIRGAGLPLRAVLLTGSVRGKEREKVLAMIRDGSADFVIGTNALIQDGVLFHHLALTVTDEQHRFGVAQRFGLSDKGSHPFSLVMSATPIPRTLALILYSGMRVSTIRDVPSVRKKIRTAVIYEKDRPTAWKMIASQVKKGGQSYIICPLVEESEEMEGENVTDYKKKFDAAFRGTIRTDILHGRMKAEEKSLVMDRFLRGETDVLISTTVVEVGVDDPNATVMMIENADHFGLAQLHQLRGRVGRGDRQSYCILMNSAGQDNKTAEKRLNALRDTTDGFALAELDLSMRGPGDLRGVRQSGEMGFIFSDPVQDPALLRAAAEDAKRILAADPGLKDPDHKGLKALAEKRAGEIYTNL